jgi:RNA polymerase sigma factor (sigma-70 family)
VARRDPLANPAQLIKRVYAYVAYRMGDGPEAEDVTSDVFERALRYRASYDPSRGEPVGWLLGIARRCVGDARRQHAVETPTEREQASPEDLEADALQRVTVASAIARLDDRSQDLVALRYGADLTARQIADMLGLTTNAVEVALHRTLAKLRPELEGERPRPEPEVNSPSSRASASAGGTSG